MSTLATEWSQLRDKLRYPEEVGQFIEPFFYSGALACLALRTDGITDQELFRQLVAYSMDNPGWPHVVKPPVP